MFIRMQNLEKENDRLMEKVNKIIYKIIASKWFKFKL